jgi:hypothetical protein
MYSATLVGQQKLKFDYEKDLEAWDTAEAKKTAATVAGTKEREIVESLAALGRKAITDKYQTDLQTLLNSQGWQGVFGTKFGALLRDNEALARQWATSTNQSLLLVKVALQGVKQMGEEAFASLAQGMSANIAHAIEYSTSIGQAMRAALAATLDSIASQALVYAIYATALGFFDLAHYDYAAAGQAFTAAAIFGSIGGAAAVAGKYAGGGAQGASGGAAARSGGSASGPKATGDVSGAVAGGGASAQAGPTVQVNINGHVFGLGGAAQLCDIINQAVFQGGATLMATHDGSGAPLG